MECLTQEYLEYFDAQDFAAQTAVVKSESGNAVEGLEAGCASTLVDDDSQSLAQLSEQKDLIDVEGQYSFESKQHDWQCQSSIPTSNDGNLVKFDARVCDVQQISSTEHTLFDEAGQKPAKKQKVYQSDRVAVISGLTFRLRANTTTVVCEDTGVCMRQAGYGSMDLYCETCQWKCHSLANHYNMRS